MENIFYQSQIEYLFVKKIDQILKLQYDEYKKQIIMILQDELNTNFKNKLLKSK